MQVFQSYILFWHQQFGRHDLPWRKTADPYKILVSELMLQQTQVERVIPKYQAFVSSFPDAQSLANASLADVLRLWQGLGYNRRAKYLHLTTKEIMQNREGFFPDSFEELKTLPGIGEYTASAIMTFAYNQPVAIIETNIRAVFIYHFFPDVENVSDQEIRDLVQKTLYDSNPRLWYSALMDYGSVLKKLHINPSRSSKTYTKQSCFRGSRRQVRGEVIRLLSEHGKLDEKDLRTLVTAQQNFLPIVLQSLESENLIISEQGSFRLAD